MSYSLSSETSPNGIQVHYIDTPHSQAASIQAWFKAGSALETPHEYGIAHFLEHMFFKGTKKRPGSKIAADVEAFGGEINAFTSFHYTCYYINCPKDSMLTSLDVLLDMVANPIFLEKDLLPEREVVFEEYRRSQDSPNQYLFQELQKKSFSGGYNHPILGNEKTIKNFTLDQLKNFRQSFYHSQNFHLIIAGPSKEKKHQFEMLINSFKLPQPQPNKKIKPIPSFHLKTSLVPHWTFRDTKMCTLNFSFPAHDPQHPHAAREEILLNILANGESSFLNQELYEKKNIINSVGASTLYLHKGGTHFLRFNFSSDLFIQVLEEFQNLWKQFIKKPILEKDLQKIKNQYLASKLYEKESLDHFSFNIAQNIVQFDEPCFDDQFIEKVQKMTLEELEFAKNDFSHKGLHLHLLYPQDEKENQHKHSLLEKNQKLGNKELLKIIYLFQPIKKLKSKIIKPNLTIKKKPYNLIQSQFDSATTCTPLLNNDKEIFLIHRQNTLTPTFSMQVYIKDALNNENQSNQGIHYLLSELLPKANQYKKTLALQDYFDYHGASLGSFSGRASYGLTLHGLSEHYPSLLKHFLSCLWEPQFNKKNFQIEKNLLNKQLLSQEKEPSKICFQLAQKELFKNHPYSLNMQGTTESLKNISFSHCLDLHKNHLSSQPIVFYYGGNLSLEIVQKQLEDELSLYSKIIKKRKIEKRKIKNGLFLSKKDSKILLSKSYQHSVKDFHYTFDREQTQIFTGFRTENFCHSTQLTLKLLNTHLSGQSSELFVDVRDRKGLCYSASPIHLPGVLGGYWGIYMASGHDKVPAAKEALNSLLEKIQIKGLSKKSFIQLKQSLEGSQILQLQTNEDYAHFYAHPFLHTLNLDFAHLQNQNLKNLSYENFSSTLSNILKTPRIWITVGRNY